MKTCLKGLLALVVFGTILAGCDEAKDDVYAQWKPIDILVTDWVNKGGTLVTLVEDDVDLVQAQCRVMADDFYLPDAPKRMPGKCVFNLADLPNPGHYVFTVRPVECFGKKGRPIKTEITVLSRFQM